SALLTIGLDAIAPLRWPRRREMRPPPLRSRRPRLLSTLGPPSPRAASRPNVARIASKARIARVPAPLVVLRGALRIETILIARIPFSEPFDKIAKASDLGHGEVSNGRHRLSAERRRLHQLEIEQAVFRIARHDEIHPFADG